MKKIIIMFMMILLCGCSSNVKESGKITCDEMNNINNPIIIDIRTNEEYNEFHLDNAINIPYDNILNDIKQYDYINKDTNIIVYCKSGARSNKAYETLKNNGYNHVYDIGSINNCK